jgi:hypothetical protein
MGDNVIGYSGIREFGNSGKPIGARCSVFGARTDISKKRSNKPQPRASNPDLYHPEFLGSNVKLITESPNPAH